MIERPAKVLLACLLPAILVSCRSAQPPARRPPAAPAADAVQSAAAGIARRVHLKFASQSKEQEFLRLVNGRKAVADDLAAVGRLSREKQIEHTRFTQQLLSEFQIKAGSRYEYDAASMTVYETLQPAATNAAARAESARPAPEKRLHMRLADKEQAARFVRLTASRQLTADQLRAFVLVSREKELELDRYRKLLLEKFSMSRDRDYQYDAKTRTLYEILTLPPAEK